MKINFEDELIDKNWLSSKRELDSIQFINCDYGVDK